MLENEPTERKVNYKTVVVTEISDDMTFYAQNAETCTYCANSIFENVHLFNRCLLLLKADELSLMDQPS